MAGLATSPSRAWSGLHLSLNMLLFLLDLIMVHLQGRVKALDVAARAAVLLDRAHPRDLLQQARTQKAKPITDGGSRRRRRPHRLMVTSTIQTGSVRAGRSITELTVKSR